MIIFKDIKKTHITKYRLKEIKMAKRLFVKLPI